MVLFTWMTHKKDDKPSYTNYLVQAGLGAYKQQIVKQKLLAQVVDDAVRDGEPTIATQIGMFVVYVQNLEEVLQQIVTVTYSFKSYYNNKDYSVMYKTDEIISKKNSLGNTVRLLKTISIRDEKTNEQILDKFVKKLDKFVKKRNGYIHQLLQDTNIKDLVEFKRSLVNANKELLKLINDAEQKLNILKDLFELDGLPYSLARHIISSEKYEPRSEKKT